MLWSNGRALLWPKGSHLNIKYLLQMKQTNSSEKTRKILHLSMLGSTVFQVWSFIYLCWNAGWIWVPNAMIYDTVCNYTLFFSTGPLPHVQHQSGCSSWLKLLFKYSFINEPWALIFLFECCPELAPNKDDNVACQGNELWVLLVCVPISLF